MKRGLLPGQVLAFIIAGIIFVVILIFGYNAISDLTKSSSDISVAELKSDFESAVDATKRSFGSVRKIELRTPNEIKELCFFDYDDCAGVDAESFDGLSLAWAVSACNAKSGNVFSIPRLVDLSMSDVYVESGYICIPNQGGLITVKLTGKGDHVNVDTWEFEG